MGIETSTGFVAIPRGLTDWEWYDDHNTCRLFFHLMLTVNWEPKNWRGIVVNAGSRITSLSNLSDETGLSVQNVRTSINRLKSTGYVTIKTTNKFSVITINNWCAITGSNKPANNQLTGNQQSTNNQLTTTKPLKPLKPLKPAAKAAMEETPDGDLPPPVMPPSTGNSEQPIQDSDPEKEWIRLGLGKRIGPALRDKLSQYRKAGIQNGVMTAAMREAAEHEAKIPLAYVGSILDRCQEQGIHTLEAWQAAHRGSGAQKRVDRPIPSGNNFLEDAMSRPRRHKRKE